MTNQQPKTRIANIRIVILWISTSESTNMHIHHFKTTFICPRSIAGVLFDSVRRFRASVLLHTTCVHLCCNWVASCVSAWQTKNQKQLLFGGRASCVVAKQLGKKKVDVVEQWYTWYLFYPSGRSPFLGTEFLGSYGDLIVRTCSAKMHDSPQTLCTFFTHCGWALN